MKASKVPWITAIQIESLKFDFQDDRPNQERMEPDRLRRRPSGQATVRLGVPGRKPVGCDWELVDMVSMLNDSGNRSGGNPVATGPAAVDVRIDDSSVVLARP